MRIIQVHRLGRWLPHACPNIHAVIPYPYIRARATQGARAIQSNESLEVTPSQLLGPFLSNYSHYLYVGTGLGGDVTTVIDID